MNLLQALPVAVAALILSASGGLVAQDAGGRAQGQGTGVMVRGKVVDHGTGAAVRSGAVSLGPGLAGVPGLGTRGTDEGGRFLFQDVPPGRYRLSVTALGYRDMVDTLHVPADTDLDLVLPLSADPIRLEPIVVEADRPGPLGPGLQAARPTGSVAYVVTRKDIEGRRPRYLTDLLSFVPGGRIAPARGFGSTLLLRGACLPGIWIDRVRISDPEGLDQLVSPDDVEAIHVYHGFDLPVELGADPCGGVVIWTRDGTPSPSERASSSGTGLWRRIGMVTGFVVLAIVLSR